MTDYIVDVAVDSIYRLNVKAKDIKEAHKKVEHKIGRIENGHIPKKEYLISQYANYDKLEVSS